MKGDGKLIKKFVSFICSEKLERLTACLSYIGVIGSACWVVMKMFDLDDEQTFLYSHAENSFCLFLISLLALPLAKQINRYYFYLLNPQLNIGLLIAYSYVIFQKCKGVKNAYEGKLGKR